MKIKLQAIRANRIVESCHTFIIIISGILLLKEWRRCKFITRDIIGNLNRAFHTRSRRQVLNIAEFAVSRLIIRRISTDVFPVIIDHRRSIHLFCRNRTRRAQRRARILSKNIIIDHYFELIRGHGVGYERDFEFNFQITSRIIFVQRFSLVINLKSQRTSNLAASTTIDRPVVFSKQRRTAANFRIGKVRRKLPYIRTYFRQSTRFIF